MLMSQSQWCLPKMQKGRKYFSLLRLKWGRCRLISKLEQYHQDGSWWRVVQSLQRYFGRKNSPNCISMRFFFVAQPGALLGSPHTPSFMSWIPSFLIPDTYSSAYVSDIAAGMVQATANAYQKDTIGGRSGEWRCPNIQGWMIAWSGQLTWFIITTQRNERAGLPQWANQGIYFATSMYFHNLIVALHVFLR